MNNPIILYRFHGSPTICRERIKLLRAFNPGVRIYALYGGAMENAATARAAVADLVVDMHTTQPHEPSWHWLHVDLDVKDWYRAVGSSLDFDFLFDYEWDLLTVDALTSIFPDIGQHAIALCSLTGLTPEVERAWPWTAGLEQRPNYERFIDYMATEFGMGPLRYVSHGPGPVLSRRFLERFAETEDIELVISEITYPAYAQALGFELYDNNFRSSAVTDPREDTRFACGDGKMIEYSRVIAQLARTTGPRAFHPVTYQVTLSQLKAGGFLNTDAKGTSLGELSADLDNMRTRLEAVADQLDACLDRETELRQELARGNASRAWRALTKWRSLKRHVTGHW